MTNTVIDTRREIIDRVLNRIMLSKTREVFAEDVQEVMNEFDLLPTLTNRVSSTLDQIVDHLDLASNCSLSITDTGLDYSEFHRIEAERGISLLIGLAALSG